MTTTMVYSTSTDKGAQDFRPVDLGMPQVRSDVWDEFCFICGRCTDHSGEHDNGVTEYTVRQVGAVTMHTIYVR